MDFLILHGAKVDPEIQNLTTILLEAIKHNETRIARAIVGSGLDLNFLGPDGLSPLHVTAKQGSFDLCQEILDNNGQVDHNASDGSTPIFWAALNGHEDVVRLFIQNGADVEHRDRSERTPVFSAVFGKTPEVLQILHDDGNVQVNVKMRGGFTPLIVAVQQKAFEMVEMLVEFGSDLESSTSEGLTALYYACYKGFHSIASYLIKAGKSWVM